MSRAVLCSLTAVALFTVVHQAKADDSKDKGGKDKQAATITKMDSKNGSMTVAMKDHDGKRVEKTLQLADSVAYVDSQGKPTDADAFHKGDRVMITEKDGKVTELKKSMRHVKATITKVDAANGTITVAMKGHKGKEVEKTFQLVEDAEFVDETGKVVAIDVFQSGDDVLLVEAEGQIKKMKKQDKAKSTAEAK